MHSSRVGESYLPLEFPPPVPLLPKQFHYEHEPVRFIAASDVL